MRLFHPVSAFSSIHEVKNLTPLIDGFILQVSRMDDASKQWIHDFVAYISTNLKYKKICFYVSLEDHSELYTDLVLDLSGFAVTGWILDADILRNNKFELLEANVNFEWIARYDCVEGLDLVNDADGHIVCLVPNSTAEVLQVLYSLVCISMQNQNFNTQNFAVWVQGELGECIPMILRTLGFEWIIAYSQGEAAVSALINRYHIKTQNRFTKRFALLGDPVIYSLGHELHNYIYHYFSLNAVYIKLHVKKEELAVTMNLLHKLSFDGLSITMPHKSAVKDWLDTIPTAPVNTLRYVASDHYFWHGINTDGLAVLKIIESIYSDNNIPVYILGSGGAAMGVVHALNSAGYQGVVFNRSVRKAADMLDPLGWPARSLQLLKNYIINSQCIIINTIPTNDTDSNFFDDLLGADAHNCDIKLNDSLAIDCVYKRDSTSLMLQTCSRLGFKCCPGEHMFLFQACLQMQWWFNWDDHRLQEAYDIGGVLLNIQES